MIDRDGNQYLDFKKYKIKSFNPQIKHLRIKEDSLIVKLAEYEETTELEIISVSDAFSSKTPDQVDVSDVKILKSSKQMQVSLNTRHQENYLQYLWCPVGESLAEDGSNAFLLSSDAMWNAEEIRIATDHEMPDPDNYFIGTFTPLTNFINDITGCRILLKETKGDIFPTGDIAMFLQTPEYSFLQKITGKTLSTEGEFDFKQNFHVFKNDQNVIQTKVVPIGFQGDGKINIYMPWMDSKRILDAHDIIFLTKNSGNDMLEKWIIDRTGCQKSDADDILKVYEATTRVTQSFLSDFTNYRIKQSTYDGWSQDQKNKYHVGDIMPGQKIYGIEAMTLAEQKTISQANDRIIDKWRANHPDWQESDTLDWRLYIALQKLLTATSTHSVTRFSVEADMTEKHRYYLPYYLTVSLPVNPDTAFQYGVAHNIRSTWFNTFKPTLQPGDPAYALELGLFYPYKINEKIRLSTPYVADLDDTEIEPILPDPLKSENLNKIAGSLEKGSNDYMKYIVHVPNDKEGGLTVVSNMGQLSVNNPDLGNKDATAKRTITKKIPTTRWEWNCFQPVELTIPYRGVKYEGNAYIIPNNGWDIKTRVLGAHVMFDKNALEKYFLACSADKKLYRGTTPWWQITPKIVSGDIVWDDSAINVADSNAKYAYDHGMKQKVPTFLYTKAQLEINILNSLGFTTKPSGWTFTATPEIAQAPNQWEKIDKLHGKYPYDDSSQNITIYRWRDIEASWKVSQSVLTNVVSKQPNVFDKLEWTTRRRLLTGETKGLDIELSSTRTEINYRDLTEIFLQGIWLDRISISFDVSNWLGTNNRTLAFDLDTDAKYDEKISSIRILF